MTQKYKLINKTTKEETICTKVTIDRFDYYVTKFNNKLNTYINEYGKPIVKYIKDLGENLVWESINKKSSACDSKYEFGSVIATTNPNIDVPKVIDEVEKLANIHAVQSGCEYKEDLVRISKSFLAGYNKSQELYPFSEADVLNIIQSLKDYTHESNNILGHDEREPIEFLEIWKSQQPKILYVKPMKDKKLTYKVTRE